VTDNLSEISDVLLHHAGKKAAWGFLIVGLTGGYVLLVPSVSVLPSLSAYNEQRALQVGALIASGTAFLMFREVRQEWLSVLLETPRLARRGLGAVLGLGIVSSALAPAPFYALLEVGHFSLLFLVAGGVAAAVRRAPKQTRWFLLGSVAISVLLYTVYFAASYVAATALPAFDVGRETITGFGNVRFFNQYQTWTLPLLAGAAIALPKGQWAFKGTVLTLVSFWWALVLASNVRGTVVAMAIAAAGAWLLFRDRSYRWLGVQAVALLLGGALYHFLFTSGGGATPQVVERLGEVGLRSERLQHWTKCLGMALADPWLGAGPMHYAWPPNDFAKAAHPHNAFFQWLAEWGIPSTALMSGLVVWGGWSWIRREMRGTLEDTTETNGVRVALVASLLAGTAHAMVSGIIVMPVSQMLLVLVGGWAWGRHCGGRGSGNSNPELFSFRAQAALCVLIAASTGAVGASLHDLAAAEERREAFVEAVDRNRFSPRYWTQGYLQVRDPSVVSQVSEED
jgi:putative inorganic carbon (HCO3(-)) transporter